MQSKATSVEAYLAELSPERREFVGAVRDVIRKNLGRGLAEGMQYGMIGYHVPHSVYPAGYHCDPRQPLPFAALASQKNYVSVYLFCEYTDPAELAWFRAAWKKSGKKLDMGKGCVRVKRLEDTPLDVIGEAIRRSTPEKFIASYEKSLAKTGRAPAKAAGVGVVKASKKKASKKKASKKKAAKKAPGRAAKKPGTSGARGPKAGLRKKAGSAKGSSAKARSGRSAGRKVATRAGGGKARATGRARGRG